MSCQNELNHKFLPSKWTEKICHLIVLLYGQIRVLFYFLFFFLFFFSFFFLLLLDLTKVTNCLSKLKLKGFFLAKAICHLWSYLLQTVYLLDPGCKIIEGIEANCLEAPTSCLDALEFSLLFCYSLTCSCLLRLMCPLKNCFEMAALQNPYFAPWLDLTIIGVKR